MNVLLELAALELEQIRISETVLRTFGMVSSVHHRHEQQKVTPFSPNVPSFNIMFLSVTRSFHLFFFMVLN